jgi:hypothetical protein
VIRPVVDVIRPSVDVVRSAVDVIRSDVDVIRSEVDVIRPDVDVIRSNVDVIRLDVDAYRPAVAAIRPAVGVVRSDVDVIRPAVDVVRPGVGVIRPGVGVVRPGVDADRPGVDVSRSDVDVVRPGVDARRPLTEVGRSGAGVGWRSRVQLEVETSNNIFWLGVGPQLMAPAGRVRPYVNATAGFSYFATTSSVKGRSSDESFADDTNFDDTPFSWGGGAGILIPVSYKARSLVFIDIGTRYHNNGKSVQYPREGGIQDLPSGAIQLSPIRSRADLVTWHVGVSIGVR